MSLSLSKIVHLKRRSLGVGLLFLQLLASSRGGEAAFVFGICICPLSDHIGFVCLFVFVGRYEARIVCRSKKTTKLNLLFFFWDVTTFISLSNARQLFFLSISEVVFLSFYFHICTFFVFIASNIFTCLAHLLITFALLHFHHIQLNSSSPTDFCTFAILS